MGILVTNPSKHKEILCIEEHGEICLLLSKMLNSNEFKIFHVKDKKQAAEYLKVQQPLLVVIENNFFEDTGIMYAVDLKAKHPGTKLIMLSAQGGERKEAAYKAGIDAFLAKPFTKSQLLHSVTSLTN